MRRSSSASASRCCSRSATRCSRRFASVRSTIRNGRGGHANQSHAADAGRRFRRVHLVLRAEAKSRSSEIIAQGEKLKSEAIEASRSEAKTQADRILAQAKAEIEQEVGRAKEALRDQVAGLVVAGAAKILRREIDAKVHADLLSELRR